MATGTADRTPVERQQALLPCPFCGHRDKLAIDATFCFVVCHGCDTFGPSGQSVAEAVARWNRREGVPQWR